MAITFSAAYLAELKKAVNTPDTIIEVDLDGGAVKFGENDNFSDVNPCLQSATSNQNKIKPDDGFCTLGTFSLLSRRARLDYLDSPLAGKAYLILLMQLGLKTATILCNKNKRKIGKSSYTLWKLMKVLK